MRRVIVSRHNAAIEFIRAECPDFINAPVISHVADAAEVAGAIVAGNVPLSIAVHAAQVWTIEMGAIPLERRGTELSIEDMRRFGARIERYVVQPIDER